MDNYCKINNWVIISLIILAILVLVLFFGIGGSNHSNIQSIQPMYATREQLTPVSTNTFVQPTAKLHNWSAWEIVKNRPYDMSDDEWAELIYGGILGIPPGQNRTHPFDEDAIDDSAELLDDKNIIGQDIATHFCKLPCEIYNGNSKLENQMTIDQYKSALNRTGLCDCSNLNAPTAINF